MANLTTRIKNLELHTRAVEAPPAQNMRTAEEVYKDMQEMVRNCNRIAATPLVSEEDRRWIAMEAMRPYEDWESWGDERWHKVNEGLRGNARGFIEEQTHKQWRMHDLTPEWIAEQDEINKEIGI